MKPSVDQVREMRNCTGLGLKDIMKIFSKAESFSEAMSIIQGEENNIAARQQGKQSKVRRLNTYCHFNGRYASIVGFGCETDFAANSEEFKAFMDEVCQLVAVADFKEENSIEYLLSWPTFKDPSITVGNLLDSLSAKTGDKIEIFGYTQKQV